MDAATRQFVRQRAGDRCEYCRLKQEHALFQPFHIDHAIALQHRGGDDTENLALACPRCNVLKGTNLVSRDPDSDQIALIFNPRSQIWAEHFRMDGATIVGITPTGRTTAWLLQMNSTRRVALRQMLIEDGEWD